jgi:guanosine-3',5'-bis(diphosphate) 3'-pyrophosphohydrolase
MSDASASALGRFSRFTGLRSSTPIELEPLLKTVRRYHSRDDIDLVERAYQKAKLLHTGQKRRSGEDYITHPLAVAQILADLGMSSETLAAALLHDTVEDTGYSITQLQQEFGPEVAHLVDGVTKLDNVKYGESSAAETVRKMVVAMAKDIRVLLIKLTDRLHNMQTIKYMPQEKQLKKAKETLEIYAPLAHRLGINAIKWELEDLAFETLYPKVYEEIVNLVTQRAPERELQLAGVVADINKDLAQVKVKAAISGRPKHYYSIYQKMILRGRDFAEIYDLIGVRILVDDLKDCYAALGAIHGRWSPIPGRFKDYIAMPKFNLYRSLHTTVIGPGGRPVEVQIRTFDMHKEAEYGVASHWKYKAKQTGEKTKAGEDMTWLKHLVDWQKDTEDPDEFLESLRYDLGQQQEIFVFTPKGDVMALPIGATPVDFAYAVHTEIGHRCIGSRVNGRLVPLDTALINGDNIEIFTSKAENAGPSQDWLKFTVTTRAKNKIKARFSKERREEYIEQGRDAIARLLRKQNLPLHRLMANQALLSVGKELNFENLDDLYAACGDGKLNPAAVIAKLVQLHEGSEDPEVASDAPLYLGQAVKQKQGSSDSSVIVTGSDDVLVRLGRCCTPVPPDEIFGYVTRGGGVSVHRSDCTNAEDLLFENERIVEVKWNTQVSGIYLVNIQVEALDRNGLLSDVTRTLSEHHVNILNASVTTSRDRIAMSRFSFEMADPKHLGTVLRAVRNIEGVYDVYRT